jgi:predicted phage-related endonuclease
MAIDQRTRARGIGASEIAAIVGLDPRRDAFAVYAAKLGLIKQRPSNQRQRRGHYFERGVIDWYSDVTGLKTEWFDETIQHRDRDWQVCTPDAWVVSDLTRRRRIGGVDAKTVAWNLRDGWGDEDNGEVPITVALQLQWSCSTADLPWWDAAALFGLDELRTYRVHRDVEIEATLLEAGESFWKDHVLARVPPPIGKSEAAQDYLKQRFPRQIEMLRMATEEEEALIAAYDEAHDAYETAKDRKEETSNALKQAIGEAEGLMSRIGKVTWKKDKDAVGTDWERIVYILVSVPCPMDHKEGDGTVTDCSVCAGSGLALPADSIRKIEALAKQHQKVTREGARKLLLPRGKAGK